MADLGPGPEKSATLREGREAARALLGRLGPQDRAVVVLRYWDELSTEEIAEALSLTVKAVKSRLHRARASRWRRPGCGTTRSRHGMEGEPMSHQPFEDWIAG